MLERMNSMAICAALCKYEPRRYKAGLPASVTPNLRSEASLSIEHAQGVVYVNQLGLDFDYEERAGLLVPGQEIDKAALAIDSEGNLGRYLPPKSAEIGGNT